MAARSPKSKVGDDADSRIRSTKKPKVITCYWNSRGRGREIAEIERRFRVNDTVMRYMTVRVDEDRKAADKKLAKRDKRKNRHGSANASGSNQAAANDEADEA